MDIKKLNNWLKDIQVRNIANSDVEVLNNSPLIMLGKGRQGAVFQVTDDICVKVFGNEEDCEREYYALSLGQETDLFPHIHAKGPLFIAMDIVKGVDVREYLQSQPLSVELSSKLIEMLITFKDIGFERIDHHKRQIYLQEDGTLKVIDVARTVWRDRVYPYPRKLLNSLGVENKAVFLSHVQEMAPSLYEEWLHYIRMEEISHQIYQVLLPERPNKETLKKLSKQLLTTDDEAKYVVQLQGLVQKVFKEEWVKTMLARGKDPEVVMEKIDEYWDSREQSQPRINDRSHNEKKRFEGEKRPDARHRDGERRFEGERPRDRDRHGPKGKKHRKSK
ncbi:hypothetical protein [Neobacillus soli]|uniref:hypothetical protein n=1 Tax=Neobacillus soli TaxID=220688 RepID=UPI0008241648|nr:hypothetical protein [Neobacillus soli]